MAAQPARLLARPVAGRRRDSQSRPPADPGPLFGFAAALSSRLSQPEPVSSSPAPSASESAQVISAGNDRQKPRMLWRIWKNQIDPAGMVRWPRARHPTKTAATVAGELGAPVETVANWLNHGTLPNGRMLVLMVCVYGPDFLAAILTDPPDWLSKAAMLAEQERLEAQIAAMQGELARQRALLGLSDSGDEA